MQKSLSRISSFEPRVAARTPALLNMSPSSITSSPISHESPIAPTLTLAPTRTNKNISATTQILSIFPAILSAATGSLSRSTKPIAITPRRVAAGSTSSSLWKTNATDRIKRTFLVSLIWNLLNSKLKRNPIIAPRDMPRIISTGTIRKDIPILTSCPPSIPKNTVKSVMATTSSIEAAARIVEGISFLFPKSLSFSLSISGTTTAGDTAAIMKPSIPP